MWQVALFALASAVTTPNSGVTVQGMAFGPRQTMSCQWFTNFENTRFEQCRVGRRKLLAANDGASIKCLARTCEQLDKEARRVAHWRKPEPPWGTFAVQLVGRVSLRQHQKAYIGDSTMTVLVEKIISVRKPK